jgi:hypothetical protein
VPQAASPYLAGGRACNGRRGEAPNPKFLSVKKMTVNFTTPPLFETDDSIIPLFWHSLSISLDERRVSRAETQQANRMFQDFIN